MIKYKVVETPASTKLMELFAKVQTQYLEGAVTANEAICKMYNCLDEVHEQIDAEYLLEQAELDKPQS